MASAADEYKVALLEARALFSTRYKLMQDEPPSPEAAETAERLVKKEREEWRRAAAASRHLSDDTISKIDQLVYDSESANVEDEL